MKKIISIVIGLVVALSLIVSASAAGYALPEKMMKQIQVGSGIKGTINLKGNADADLQPFFAAVQNAEYELRGIHFSNNEHYYIYQAGENEQRNNLSEILKNDEGKIYLRSDLIEGKSYQLPNLENILGLLLKADGTNPSVLSNIIQAVLSEQSEEGSAFNTDALERQIETWITSFATETAIQKSEEGTPRLFQEFVIPLNELYGEISSLIRYLSKDEGFMTSIRTLLSEEQAALYLNPNLEYFYLEALNHLNLKDEIRLSRSLSTMGELISSSLQIPLDEEKTGFSSIVIQTADQAKSYLITGAKGTYMLKIPADFDLKKPDFDDTLSFVYVNNEDEKAEKLSLKISVTKKHETYDDPDESKTHEKDHYVIHIARDTSVLPEQIHEEMIPDMESANAEIDIHYSSKMQLSSPTALEIAAKVEQGKFWFELNATIKTASPWTFSPFEVSDAVSMADWQKDDYINLKNTWIKYAAEKLIHFAEEIRQMEISAE